MARRSLDRKITVRASVVTVPARDKAAATVSTSGNGPPVTAVNAADVANAAEGATVSPRAPPSARERHRKLARDARVVQDQ
jgi:hypothetical protein